MARGGTPSARLDGVPTAQAHNASNAIVVERFERIELMPAKDTIARGRDYLGRVGQCQCEPVLLVGQVFNLPQLRLQ